MPHSRALFHLKGKHLLAKQLIEGLEKEVFWA